MLPADAQDLHPVPTQLIGTPAFFPTLLQYIRNAAPNPASLPLDKVLLQSILLCLIAGNNHLILCTPEEDISLVVKLTVWTLQSLFSLRTSKLKIRPRARTSSTHVSANPNTFIRSLFMPSFSGQGGESSQDESRHGHTRDASWGSAKHRKKKRKSLKSMKSVKRSSGGKDLVGKLGYARHGDEGNARPHSHHGHGSQATVDSSSGHAHVHNHHDAFHDHISNSGGYRHYHQRISSSPKMPYHHVPASASISPLPIPGVVGVRLGLGTAASAPDALETGQRRVEHYETPGFPFPHPAPAPTEPPGGRGKAKLHHAHTDPFPMPHRFGNRRGQESGKEHEEMEMELPQALVISGLENASLSSQRELSAALAEGRVILNDDESDEERKKDGDNGMNLPEGFLLVSVCRWDPRERVAIEKTLLDKFTLSTPIFVSQGIRNAVRSIPFASPTLGGNVQHLAHPKPHRAFSYSSYSNPSSPSPAHVLLPQSQTPPPPRSSSPHIQRTPPPPSGSPHAHIRPSHPYHIHPHHSYHHVRHSSLPALVPPNLIPPSFISLLRDAHQKAYFPPQLEVYLSDLFSAIRHWHELDGTLLTARARKEAEDMARAWRVLGTDLTGMELMGVGVPDIEGDSVLSGEDADGDGGWEADVPDVVIDMRSVSFRSKKSSTGSMHTAQEDQGEEVPLLSVTEVDVGRTVPRVVTHRLRVREKEDEILASVVHGATWDKKEGEGRRSVKDILVQILAEV